MTRQPQNPPEPADRPLVFVNMAMTADGKIATANGAVASFGSARDHAHLLALRATADAVMAGARTIDLNPVNLGPGPVKYRRQRLRHGLREYNLRLIVSGSGSINPHAEIFRHRFSPIVLLTTGRASRKQIDRLRPLVDEIHLGGDTEIDFPATLRWLRAKWEVKRLLCEGGGQLNGALFKAGLVDELHLTVCPRLFGGRNAPTIADGLGAETLAGAVPMELRSARRAGDEMFFVYRVKKLSVPPPRGSAASA